MNKVWFTADTHFYHDAILKYCNRPFANIEEMNETIIDNWNKVVDKNDIVYHLGDFGFVKKSNEDKFIKIFNRLNGQKNLVLGNHDENVCVINDVLKWNNIYIKKKIKINDKYYVLNHEPMLSWNASFHGSRHLHGHTHGTIKPRGYAFDVGVDSWNFTPINIDTVEEFISKQERYIENNFCMPEGKIWQGRDSMLTFKNAFFGDGKYDNVDPDTLLEKDPDEFKTKEGK